MGTTAAPRFRCSRNANNGTRAGGRVVAGPALADQSAVPRVVQSRSDVSHRRRREPGRQPQRLHAGHQDRAACRPGRSASRGRSPGIWRSRSATSATAATTSGRRSTTTAAHQRQQLHGIRGENLVANGFLNEFKVAMANLQANNASGAANRAGSFAYFGGGTGTTPLPIYLAYLNGRTDAGNPAAYGLGRTGRRSTPRPRTRTPRLPAGSLGRTRTPTARRWISTTT